MPMACAVPARLHDFGKGLQCCPHLLKREGHTAHRLSISVRTCIILIFVLALSNYKAAPPAKGCAERPKRDTRNLSSGLRVGCIRQMRNLFHIFLVISLLISTAGFAVTKHFCGEVLASMSIGAEESKPCCDANSMPADCDCHSDTNHESVDDDFQLDQQVIKLTPALQATLTHFLSELRLALLLDEPSRKLLFHSKQPLLAESDIYVKVQSFLL